MRSYLTPKELEKLLPADSAVTAHCRRVAALALEIGSQMAVSGESRIVLEQAALLHHTVEVFVDPGAFNRLIADVLPAYAGLSIQPACRTVLPGQLQPVLYAFHHILRPEPDREARMFAEIVTLSDFLDQQMECLAIDPQPIAEVWAGLSELKDLFHFDVLEAAAKALAPNAGGRKPRVWKLPVQAMAAKETLRALGKGAECDLAELTSVAGRDPVMAGRLLQSANAAVYARLTRARSVHDAITTIGCDAARRILMAAALEPVFASSKLLEIWRHSVRMAQFFEGLARTTGFMPPEEALLLGLVHDIGSVACQSQERGSLEIQARLAEKGCPPVYGERLLLGQDHGEIGAAVLASWQFPEDLVEAVRYHHRPADSDSVAASALYVSEFWAETDEDLPSIRHLSVAMSRADCTRMILAKAQGFDNGLTNLLRVA